MSDYYKALGVEKNAEPDDIKKAYKKLALKYHPDRNHEKSAAEKFKQITEAYETLKDEQKRAQYDQFGINDMAGFGASGFHGNDIFSHFQDMFGSFFHQQPVTNPYVHKRAQTLATECKVSISDTYMGCKKDLTLDLPITCSGCAGTGCKPKTQPIICSTCGGAGKVTANKGFIVFTHTCEVCRGVGKINVPCKQCDSRGFSAQEKIFSVELPAGLQAGQRLRLNFTNNFVRDIFVHIVVDEDKNFCRRGNDLIIQETISFPEAVLGVERTITLPNGKFKTINIPAGIQFGEAIILKGLGFIGLENNEKGNLQVSINIPVPCKVSKTTQHIIEKLQAELKGTNP